ncbi:MAG: HAMP domain-containing sensor histidine kinase [Novosphingobium sp.]
MTRFAFLAFLCQLPVTGGVLLFAQQRSENALTRGQQEWVEELRRELLIAYHGAGPSGLARAIAERHRSVRGDLAVILLARGDGTPIAGNLGAWPPVIPDQTPWRTIDLYRVDSDRPETIGLSAMLLPDGTRLLTGRVIDASVRLSQINAEAMVVALLLGIVLTLLSALLLARIFSRQVERIVRTTAAIGDGALTDRVPVDGSGDAFDALGEAINAMLDRIESLISELRLLTDGLAHDLKSPVTRLKSVLEHAILETRDPHASAALEKVAQEAETLLGMLTTALLISRTEAGIGRDRMKRTDLETLLSDLAEVYGPLAENDGFTIDTHAAPALRALLHRELMSQAIGNLIENALKYAARGSRITLSAAVAGGMLQLAVADDGPGIPEWRREEALRRFGRLDPARHASGSGLGLSLVAAVARLHGGDVALEDNGPGLRVVLTLVA